MMYWTTDPDPQWEKLYDGSMVPCRLCGDLVPNEVHVMIAHAHRHVPRWMRFKQWMRRRFTRPT